MGETNKRWSADITLLCFVLFCSGGSALIFETLWLRLLGLTFSNAVQSVAFILSSFMAGLALGNAIAAFLKPRRIRPLQMFVILEILVGISGTIIVFVLPNVGHWLRPLFERLWDHEAILNLVRLALSFLSLLIPTTAMGLSLPMLLEDEILREADFRRAIGFFYGFNTLGAVAGALTEEFLLVPAVGIRGTALFATILNCVCGLVVWAKMLRSVSTATISPRGLPTRPAIVPQLWRPLTISFGTGAILLSLEVVWFRFLRLYISSSPSAFAIMLGVVLMGIGVGAFVFGSIGRARPIGTTTLPKLLLVIGILTLLTYALFPMPFLARYGGAGWSDFGFDSWWEIALLALALIFPVAVLSGMLFPAVTTAVQSISGSRINSVGATTLCNTAGAAMGPLLAGFFFLPTFGFQTTLIISAAAYGLLALIASSARDWIPVRRGNLILLSLSFVLILTFVLFPYRLDQQHFAHSRRPFEADGSFLVRRLEGTADTLQLLRRDLYGEPYYNRLVTNAFSMSSTQFPNQRYMRLFAYLPLAIRPNSTDALLICYGCGVTASALTHDAALSHVDIVDISKEVLQLASDYPPPNPLKDPRVRTFVQDGRFFLEGCPRQYDVITGEPPPPKVAGTVNLYTREFFQLMRDRLKDGGIATFWLPIYQLTLDETQAILRAFHETFSNASVWAGPDEEWIMMGIKGSAVRLDQDGASTLWKNPGTRADLLAIGLEVPEQMPALFVMDGADIEKLTAKTAPLTDMFPKRLSDASANRQAVHDFAWSFLNANDANRRFRNSHLMNEIWPTEFKAAVQPFFVIRETRYRSETRGGNKMAELDLYLRSTKLREPVLEVLGTDAYRTALGEKVNAKLPTPPNEALPDLIANALANRDLAKAIELLERERAAKFANDKDLLLLVYLHCLNGNVDRAERIAAETRGNPEGDSLKNWLWGKLQAEYGFHPPPRT